MAGPVKHTTPCISLQQLSKWIGQLLHCVTPSSPRTWNDIIQSLPYATEFDDAQVIYEPINLRATLWGIKRKHPLVELALEVIGDDANCTLLVKDATIPGRKGLFLLYCTVVDLAFEHVEALKGELVDQGIYSCCKLDDKEGLSFHAVCCYTEEA